MPYVPSQDEPKGILDAIPRSTESWSEYARRIGITNDDRIFSRFGASPAGRTLLPEQLDRRRKILKDIENGLKRLGQEYVEVKITADEMLDNRDVIDTLGVERGIICILAKGKYCQFIFSNSLAKSWWFRRQIVSDLPESLARVDSSLAGVKVHLSYEEDAPAAEALREMIKARAMAQGYTFSITIEPLVMQVHGTGAR